MGDESVLVTGGAGFIGSHLVDRLLADGARRVTVVDSFFMPSPNNLAGATARFGDALVVYREDAADPDAMREICRREKPQIVYDLATKALEYSFFNPRGAFSVNTDVTATLAELLRDGAYARLVHLSSSEVYGTAEQVPMTEDHPLNPETTYAAGKAAADLLLASYVRMFELDIVIVRPFNNYGPRQNSGSHAAVVPITMKRLLSGMPPVIHGGGQQTRDFMFVTDTVDRIVRVAATQGARGTVVNVGTGQETSIQEVVDRLCECAGYTGPQAHEPRRTADVTRHLAGVARLKGHLGGDGAVTSLSDGLALTFDWYRQNR